MTGPSDLRDQVFLAWDRSDENPKNRRGQYAPQPQPAEVPAVQWVEKPPDK